ncbi:hypothetical protein SAMN02745248_01149 [Hathewaya proteolytica DSM 3090]|uniref:Uncharacterized protein n=1 Tax=Hathewaya proteolytica DSM 3090 TaxID=1121331 RepID=A0A1M6MSF0_9CLOT|nr:hypothetical protein [Hathewaya proteolytica]SHJ86455.1 hypothetical protein SAMN02745248_01149 [Hathewaya proteolytica DSM 3090]
MKKKIIAVMVLLVYVLTIVGCGKSDINNSKDKVQIWSYKDEIETGKSEYTLELISKARNYCNNNNIPYEMCSYSSKDMSKNDYVLKRNLSISKGNSICIGDMMEMEQCPKQHADYSKIPNYSNINESFKGFRYIPLDINLKIRLINRELLDIYNLKYNNEFINDSEYYEIILSLIEEGASLSIEEDFSDLGIVDIFPEEYLKTLIRCSEPSYTDIGKKNYDKESYKKLYKGIIIKFINKYKNQIKNKVVWADWDTRNIKDGKTGKNFDEYEMVNFTDIWNTNNHITLDIDFEKYVPSYNIRSSKYCIYMSEKVTNNKAYDLVNYLISEEALMDGKMYNFLYPTFKYKELYKDIGYDANGKYIGSKKYFTEEIMEQRGYTNGTKGGMRKIQESVYKNILEGPSKQTQKEIEKEINKVVSDDCRFRITSRLYRLAGEKIKNNDLDLDKELEKFLNELRLEYGV